MNRTTVAAATGLLTAALLAGCGHAANVSSPGRADAAGACAVRPTGDPTTAEACTAIVGRLNAALTAALDGKLPPDAEIINNLFSGNMQPVGGPGLTFVPREDDSLTIAYQASLRVTASTAAATGEVEVGRYTAEPPGAPCPDAARIADLKSKGATVNCDRTVGADGTVTIVHTETEAFSDGPNPPVGRSLFVQCYRPDGVTVSVSLNPQMDDQPMPPGEAPTLMTLDQVMAVASDPALTL